MDIFLHNDEQNKDIEKKGNQTCKEMQTPYKNFIMTISEEMGVVFTHVLLGGYALHILLISLSGSPRQHCCGGCCSRVVSGVTTLSQHTHKKGTGCHGNQLRLWHRADAVKVPESQKAGKPSDSAKPGAQTDSWSLQEFSVLQESELLFKTRPSKHFNLNKQHFSMTKS